MYSLNSLAHGAGIFGVVLIALASFTRVGILGIVALRAQVKRYTGLLVAETFFFSFLGLHQVSVAIDLYYRHFGPFAAYCRLASGVAALISVFCLVFDMGVVVATLDAGAKMARHEERNEAQDAVFIKATQEAKQTNRENKEADRQMSRDNLLCITESLNAESCKTLARRRQYGGG